MKEVVVRETELTRFDAVCAQLHADHQFQTRWETTDILHLVGKEDSLTGTLIAATHGNEPAGVQVLADFIQNILDSGDLPAPNLFFVLANRRAYMANTRYIECDLNRQYGSTATDLYEESRAQEIKKALDQSDFSVDFHQTVELCRKSFFLAPDDGKAIPLCNLLDSSLPILVHSFSKSVATSRSYMTNRGCTSVTVELRGGITFDSQARASGQQVLGKISALDRLPVEEGSAPSTQLEVTYHEPYSSGAVTFIPEVQTFDWVKEGDLIGFNDKKPIFANAEGFLILYPSPLLKPEHKPIATYFVCSVKM